MEEPAVPIDAAEPQAALPSGADLPPHIDATEVIQIEVSPERTSARGLDEFFEGRTLLSGSNLAWSDLFAQVYSRHSKQEPFLVPAVAEPLVIWVMSGEAVVEEREPGGEWTATTVGVGDFFLTRSDSPYEMRWSAKGFNPFQVMHLSLSLHLFERVANEMLGLGARPRLLEMSGVEDEQLAHFVALIHRELTAEGRGSKLFVTGLAQSLAVHLIRKYASYDAGGGRKGPLPGFKLRRAIAHIEDHLAEPFNLAELAAAVGLSEFHFSRLFKRSTGLSPSRYLIRQRVARAQRLLQETDFSIIRIGNSVGYSSPSHFAQVFRRETGLSPSRYRRS